MTIRSRPALKIDIRRYNNAVDFEDPANPSAASMEAVIIPYQDVRHARHVPLSPSYFTREPHFNDLYIRLTSMLTKYHHLPTLPPNEAPLLPWMRLEHIRQQMGEPIKASYFSKVIRVAKRLNLIEPSVRPQEVNLVIKQLTRAINPFENRPRPITLDKFGRAVGTGKRKESTARAFVVEGTGEVLVNGKTLTEVFGRVHDRESAIWALTATQRIDKYNVWALVKGGGTTGQAEALTLAVAKALLAHEPALKPALRKGKLITQVLSNSLNPLANFSVLQLAVSQGTTGQLKGRSMASSRLARARHGSSVNLQHGCIYSMSGYLATRKLLGTMSQSIVCDSWYEV